MGSTRGYLTTLILLLFQPLSGVHASELRFALLGHTYYLLPHEDIQDRLVRSINREQPAYVFALGDVVVFNRDKDWEAAQRFFARLDAEVVYSPGNHDLFRFDIVEGWGTNRFYPEWRQRYIDRIGYVNRHVRHPKADFVLINSVDPFFLTRPFLDGALASANPETPTYLLTHQRVWLERYQDHWIHWYWKGIRREEFLPYIRQFDQMFIGDLWGGLEVLDIEGTPAAMVGMGNRDRPVFYVMAVLRDGHLTLSQRTLSLPPEHPYHD